ncbi:hypothetical protein [Aquimarina litoralis]|uniref:hypothetical protein n=1 Tax=Aquimarina litoralis TaxID=584605 RepID=UPI001C583986|nr:hypothetical protein [Aquimarina litoralis]MBW1298652.1 hypothetical protein [Aquimarina litoralis]
MRNSIFLLFVLISSIHAFGQDTNFDNLTANYGRNKSITWFTSTYGSGFGHRILNTDPGGQTLLNFQGRHNSATWSDILTLTSNGNVGIGTATPSKKLDVNGSIAGQSFINVQKGGSYLISLNGNEHGYITGRNSSFQNKFQIASNGFTYFNGGNVGIGTATPQAKFEIKSGGTIGGNWNPSASFLTISDSGTSKMIMDSNEIYGNGTLHIGSSSGDIIKFRKISANSTNDMMIIKENGDVGIGTTAPQAKLHVSSGVRLRKTAIGMTIASGDNGWIRDEWLTGNYGVPVWNQTLKKWVRPSGTYNDFGGIVYQDEGTYFLREKPGSKLEFSNSEFLNTSYMFVHMFTGNIGIGTTNPDAKLAVNGNIHTKEVRVDLNGWADYVFKEDYDLPSLQQVEDHIATKGHLINIPSAAEVEENGIQLGEMNAKLLEKIEELTLYTIAQEKAIKEQEKRNNSLETKNKELEERLEKLEKIIAKK